MVKDRESLSEDEFVERLSHVGRREGFFAPLGQDHAALFADREAVLLVTFDAAAHICSQFSDGLPYGFSLAQGRDWSHLSLIAHRQTWFRDPEVYGFFDRLTDDGFFDQYDRVIFFGAGPCGYAAAAYSVACPGATVILVQPQATLDPTYAGWDPRFENHRRLNFTDRYGFAPDMSDGAREVFVIFDPAQTYDAMHAALFRRSFTTFLPCRNMGSDLLATLSAMHVLPSTLAAAGDGAFDARLFWTFYRARRNHLPYLRRLLNRLETDGRPGLAALLANNAGGRLNDERFRARARDLAASVRGMTAG
ncbi:phosphoadenosine phosphosulfate reductase [Frigidibacter sp. SD6-1]|uniref:phosphoadenosine phosphosulfate reductase n=1 Tax=Frigidibacter sp. SD6-1 TaxID=3032581 RepID=UPI0024DF7906|nr:phosphoadenosine phosphosulfate reductase [Frigidibacter sp. SD6-1]